MPPADAGTRPFNRSRGQSPLTLAAAAGVFLLSLATILWRSPALASPVQSAPASTNAPNSSQSSSQNSSQNYAWFDPIVETRLLLANAYIDAGTDPEADRLMQEAALAAMVASLGDPYTVYVPPENEREFTKELRGTYVGIGAEIDIHENYLRIVTPLDDSPAQRAGILAGDLVLSIDGQSTLGKSADDCMELLLGEEGTPVTINVRHSDGREEEFTLTRARINAQTVKGFRRTNEGWEHLLDPERGIAYIRLSQFTETSAESIRDTVQAIQAKGGKGLVIDLRFNGGGALGAAIQIADLFQRSGTIVSLRSRDGQGRAWNAADAPTDFDLPIVILVNEGSASASEILAGALQDNQRAKILGTRTFGKGSVQDVRELPENRGTIKLTTARYYLPSGRNITRSPRLEDEGKPWGVDPDPGYHVSMTDEEERAMFIARRLWEIPNGKPTDPARWADPAWIGAKPDEKGETGLGDLQLAAAVTALRGKLADGAWPRVGDDPGEAVSMNEELHRMRGYRDRLIRELEATDKRIADLASSEAVSNAAEQADPASKPESTRPARPEDSK